MSSQRGKRRGASARTERFQANTLKLTNLRATVTIEPHDKPHVEVAFEGPADQVAAITAEVIELYRGQYQPDILKITAEATPGTDFARQVHVSIKAPATIEINLLGRVGEVNIGSMKGQLLTLTKSNGNVTAKSVSRVHLTSEESGDVHIGELLGESLTILHKGAGDVIVEKGSSLDCIVLTTESSTGKISIGSTVMEGLVAQVEGAGDVTIARSLVEPSTQKMTGTGMFRVDQVG